MSGSITVPTQYANHHYGIDSGIVELTHEFPRFGFVIAAVATTAWLGVWQAYRVGGARREAKIAYPQSEYLFLLPVLGFRLVFTWLTSP
jgi:hypothetical protein